MLRRPHLRDLSLEAGFHQRGGQRGEEVEFVGGEEEGEERTLLLLLFLEEEKGIVEVGRGLAQAVAARSQVRGVDHEDDALEVRRGRGREHAAAVVPQFAVAGGVGEEEAFVDLQRGVVRGAVPGRGGFGGDGEGDFDG